MFSPIGAPKDDKEDIDWLGDLKFFIDNDSDVLSKQFFPAIRKHQEYKGHPDAYKLYIKPLEGVCETKDHEASMARAELLQIAKNARTIFNTIQDGQELPGWVSSYITLANDHLNSVAEKMEYNPGVE